MCLIQAFHISFRVLILARVIHSLCIKAANETWVRFESRGFAFSERATCAVRIFSGDCSSDDGKLFFLNHYLDKADFDYYYPEQYDDYELDSYDTYKPDNFYSYNYPYSYNYEEDGKEAFFNTCYARCLNLDGPRLSCDGESGTKLEFVSIETEWTCQKPKRSKRASKKLTFFQSRFATKSAALGSTVTKDPLIPDCAEEDL